MILREFKAKMVDDFKNEWLLLTSRDEGMTFEETTDAYGGDDLNALDNRISGEVVTINENTYSMGDNDFFENEDNNFVIHAGLFEEVQPPIHTKRQ